MKYYGLWNPNYTGWRSEQVETNYFGEVVFSLVEKKLESEFTVEDFINKFNTLQSRVRTTNFFGSVRNGYVMTLYTNGHSYRVVSECLHYMVTQKQLKARYVSVGSRTETIFEKN